MEEYIANDILYPPEFRQRVFAWAAEYSQLNHARMISIVSLCLKKEISKKDQDTIFKIGCDIHKQGGFTAQQACYYIAKNFISRHDPAVILEIQSIQCLWDGAGDWKY